MAVACLMAVAGGCSSPEGSSSTTHSSTPDVTDKMTALLGPIIEHEGGRFSGVEISRSTGTPWMTNSAGKETTQITFGPDTQLENVSSQPRHYRDRPSVDPKDFDLDDYLAKVSETSKSCGEGQYWSVSAEVISSTASIVTQRCGMTDQGSSFLNRQPIAPITNVWSLEGLTTIWNEMLTFAPKGYVRDIGIKNSNVTILFATEYPPTPCAVGYYRSWGDQKLPAAHVFDAHCTYDASAVSTNKVNLNAYTAEEIWARAQELAQEKNIHFDEETTLSLSTDTSEHTVLTLIEADKGGFIYLDNPQ